MEFPVRCFTCGKVIGHLYEEFAQETRKGKKANVVLDDLGVKRYCCRRMFISYVDLISEVVVFKKL